MQINLTNDVLGFTGSPSNLLFRNPIYDDRWWWRELGRVSYLGGREYARPKLLSIAHQRPRFGEVKSPDGIVTSTNQFLGLTDTTATKSLLFRHEREEEWEFFNRQTRAHYDNIVRTVANSLVSHATKKGPLRDGDAQIEKFWEGVDLKRSKSIDTFVKEIAVQADVQDIMWACVDCRSTEQGGDGVPYTYPVSPLDILDWDVDDNGELLWLKQIILCYPRRAFNEPVTLKFRFRVWERKVVTTYQTDLAGGNQETIATDTNPIGVVPFLPFYSIRDDAAIFPSGTARLGDFCKAANHVYNLKSLLSEICYKQNFSLLLIPDKNVDKVQLGVSAAMGYDAQRANGAEPKFISPDPDQARVLIEAIQSTIEQERQGLGIGRGRQESSMQKSSEGALELESDDKRSILVDIADECQDFERRLVAMANRYRSQAASAEATEKIQYPTDFDTRSLEAEIDEALSLRKLQMSPEVDLEVLKQIVSRKFSNMAPDDQRRLIDSLKLKTPEELKQESDLAIGRAIEAPAPSTVEGSDPASPAAAPGAKPGAAPAAKATPVAARKAA